MGKVYVRASRRAKAHVRTSADYHRTAGKLANHYKKLGKRLGSGLSADRASRLTRRRNQIYGSVLRVTRRAKFYATNR